MAQYVGYFENNVTYTEGPFVVVNAGGFRIEVEQKDWHCPVMPEISIYRYLEENNMPTGKFAHKEPVERSVDWLNEQVRVGNIVLVNNTWVRK